MRNHHRCALPRRLIACSTLLIALAGCANSSRGGVGPPYIGTSAPSPVPRGWVPVTDGKVQVSVPASWGRINSDCPWGKEPGVVIQRNTAGFTGCVLETGPAVPNVLRIAPLRRAVLDPSQRRSEINGIQVVWGRPSAGMTGYQVPSEGLQIDATGPVARRALETLAAS